MFGRYSCAVLVYTRGILVFGVVLGSFLFISIADAQPARPNLPDAANGRAAIAILGSRLPDVAQRNGLSAAKLRQFFVSDESLWIDKDSNLFYVEESIGFEAADEPLASGGAPAQDNYSPSQAFFLNSKPGSSRTILLDFDGHLVSDTAWNSSLGDNYQAPPFDLDSNPSSFSDAERNRIIGIWKRVAEDYAPFDVNVTTQDPGESALNRSSSSDNVYGTRAVISKRNATCSGCGGVAYVGTFDSTNNAYYQPAWVFYDALGSGNEKYTAEAISHEVGHNGGLSHDGTSSVAYYQGHGSGATGWAPIMGNGYYKPLTQFSKGEYPDANNSQDDFFVFASNGIAVRNDDHGDTRSSATYINQGASFESSGIIEDRNDTDYFSFFAGAGEVTLNLIQHSHGANMDLELSVYNSSGQLLGQANPQTQLEAALVFVADQEGTYFIRVDGVGFGTTSTGYSDYGSLGYYTITGSLTTGGGNTAPQAIATGAPLTGTAPLVVSFSGSQSFDSDGSIVSYAWNFGDGSSASGIDVQHTFASGSYNVILTVVDNQGVSNSDSITVVAQEAPNQAPTAVASASSTSGIAPHDVNFSSSGSFDPDGSIVSYLWTFGDGSSSSSANPSHLYSSPGTYQARLTVTDEDGVSDSASVSIQVDVDPNYIAEPTNLSATVSGSSVTLNWSDNSDSELGFKIYLGTESGKGRNKSTSWELIATVGANTSTYQVNSLAEGSYLFQVGAYHNTNEALSSSVKVSLGGGGKGGGGKGGGKK